MVFLIMFYYEQVNLRFNYLLATKSSREFGFSWNNSKDVDIVCYLTAGRA